MTPARYRKLGAALTVPVGLAVSALADGVLTGQEAVQIAGALLAAGLVWLLPNETDEKGSGPQDV